MIKMKVLIQNSVEIKTNEKKKQNEYKFKIYNILKDDKIEIEIEYIGILNHHKENKINIPKINNNLNLKQINLKGKFEHINGMKEIRIWK